MTPNEYQTLALAKEKDQLQVFERFILGGTTAMRMQNGFNGLANEVGELAEIIKKWIEYGRPLDTTALIEEVGDCLWRLCQISKAGGFTLETAMLANLRKLDIRYKDRCTDEEAVNRNLEAERKSLELPPSGPAYHGHGTDRLEPLESLEVGKRFLEVGTEPSKVVGIDITTLQYEQTGTSLEEAERIERYNRLTAGGVCGACGTMHDPGQCPGKPPEEIDSRS